MSSDEGKKKKEEKFLRKAEREVCWKARDSFWACMTTNKEDTTKCMETREQFQTLCPASWVTHFDRKFQYNKFKAELDSLGSEPLDEEFVKSKSGGQK